MRSLRMAASLLVISLPVVSAQTVILPTIRTSKTAEFTMLDHAIQDIRNDSTRLALFSKQPSFPVTTLSCDLARLALTPYSVGEVASARNSDSASARNHDGSTGGVSFLRVAWLLQATRKKHVSSDVPQYLADALARAPNGCNLSAPPSEEDVRTIMEKYLETEDNIGRHARLDTLTRVALANVIHTKLRKRHWFPVRSHDQAMAFWRQPASSSLNVGAVTGSGNQGATFTEISSQFLHPIRLSFNTVISSAKDSVKSGSPTAATAGSATSDTGTSVSAVARFLNGGGLLNIAATIPWIHYGSPSGSGDLIGLFAPRFGGTLPVLGASSRDTTLMYDVGTELFFKSADYIDGIGLFLQSRIAMAGGSARFMSLIGDGGKTRTFYQTVSFGISLDEKYLLTLSRTVAGPHSIQTGWQIGATLARSAAQPSNSGR